MKIRNAHDVFLQQLRSFYSRPHCKTFTSRRHYTVYDPNFVYPRKTSSYQTFDVGILGGGITGLVSAYWLSKTDPNAKITLYEAGSRLGGWLNTQKVKIPDHGEVLFERGPRSLRPALPNGAVTLYLIEQLGLDDQILTTPNDAPAATNRFIYYPDHIVRMPHLSHGLFSIGRDLFTEEIFSGAIGAVFNDLLSEGRSASLQDESVGDFISRRFSPKVADNLLSAVIHGIYAGDIYSLSAKSLLPSLWEAEAVFGQLGTVIGGMRGRRQNGLHVLRADVDLLNELKSGHQDDADMKPDQLRLANDVRGCSVFTLRGGLGQLSDQLVQVLASSKNVSIQRDSYVQEVGLVSNTKRPEHKIQVRYASKDQRPTLQQHTHIISTIGGSHLHALTKDPTLAILAQTPSVTVMVVNLYFPHPNILPIRGFGYLIPRSVPFEQNPERALGVVFDSDATIGQDSAPGTKLTVMLGGHWWNDWTSYPSSQEGIAMARAILQRHLGVVEAPIFAQATLQKDCIPQYTVGHEERMVKADRALRTRWDGRLLVAGNSYAGVGVNDCVRGALDVVLGLTEGRWKTGLERFTDDKTREKVQLKPYEKLSFAAAEHARAE